MRLKSIIEQPETPGGRAFAFVVQGLIILSLVSFSLGTLPDLSPQVAALLGAVEVATVVFFTVEYLLRLAVADSRLGYVTSFFGLVDLAAILPFYLATGIDLRAVRAVRLLRLVRILKLVRYNAAIDRFRRALALAREEVVLFFAASAILLFLAAVGIYYFENAAQPLVFRSIFDGLWWATATLTTVGYGDVYPVTIGGKLFTFLILMIGLGIVALPAGLVAAALSEVRRRDAARADAGVGPAPLESRGQAQP